MALAIVSMEVCALDDFISHDVGRREEVRPRDVLGRFVTPP
jgi:hypothetical protein